VRKVPQVLGCQGAKGAKGAKGARVLACEGAGALTGMADPDGLQFFIGPERPLYAETFDHMRAD
jgi:hypothetical protein